MQLYNSLTRSLEEFSPAGPAVSLYVCGITPYDTTHLGHAFTYCSVDLLVRYLEHRGHRVRYVQNVTDIDDDILRAAARVGEDWRSLGDHWTAHFIQDMIALQVRPPDVFPRASEVVSQICAQVQRLVEAGAAYVREGSVYYDLRAWPEYGRLSGLTRQEMLPVANERGNRPDDPNKRDPLDFVLWQAQAPGEPAWESPWGPGRPGWHIECSTMAGEYLGETVDIHAGGADLIFPHHESEIAQAEPLSSRPFVRIWMHIAMVELEGQKMSKSLGNLIMVRDLLRKYSADALRLYLADHHYRSAWGFSEDALRAAQLRAAALRSAAGRRSGDPVRVQAQPLEPEAARQAFQTALEADLDAPTALKALEGLAAHVQEGAGPAGPAQRLLRELAGVLGLRLGSDPEPRVRRGWRRQLERFQPEGSTV